MRIIVLPLDERPVNAHLPGMVAAIAGAETEVPPGQMLPRMREPGDAEALSSWIDQRADDADVLVVSLDMLGYGGLIASRTSTDRTPEVLARLSVLERIRARNPELPISGVTTVMRASDSYNSGEEPDYWPQYGRELHRLGGALHRDFLGEPNDLAEVSSRVPNDARTDFVTRRLRNHAVDLYCLGLANTGVVAPMLVTADDTAERAAGSVEQVWLRYWANALGPDLPVLSYPGADEVCSALTARALIASTGLAPRIAVMFPEQAGADRVAPYENVPVATTVANQIRAAGAVAADSPQDADAVLVVHAPDAGIDQVPATLAGLNDRVVGLADVRRPNGSDPALIERLIVDDLVDGLAAYGGWNTAGNTLGSVVAALVAGVIGRQTGGYNRDAERRLLLHRLVEDHTYQAVTRTRLAERTEYGGHQSVPFPTAEAGARYLAEVEPDLHAGLESLGQPASGWNLTDARLPWNRTFEIDFALRQS